MENISAVYISLSEKKIWPLLHEQDWKSVPFYMNMIIIQFNSEDTLYVSPLSQTLWRHMFFHSVFHRCEWLDKR